MANTYDVEGSEIEADLCVYIPVFRQSVFYFDSFEQYHKACDALDMSRPKDGGLGHCVWFEKDDTPALHFVVAPIKSGLPCLVHETIHAVDHICSQLGIPISEDNAEIRCYMTEFLFAEITAHRGKGKKK